MEAHEDIHQMADELAREFARARVGNHGLEVPERIAATATLLAMDERDALRDDFEALAMFAGLVEGHIADGGHEGDQALAQGLGMLAEHFRSRRRPVPWPRP